MANDQFQLFPVAILDPFNYTGQKTLISQHFVVLFLIENPQN